MRFFKLACVFGLLVACLGCVRNWNDIIGKDGLSETSRTERKDELNEKSFERYRNWVKPQGSDPRAREIENSLGIR